jgi:hypothetical protein
MDATPPAIVAEPDAQMRAVPPIEPEGAPRSHVVDLGVASFLKSGIADGGVTGVAAFVAAGLGRDVFLRIAGAVGQRPATDRHLTWLAGRLDACAATTGNYAEGSGLRLDLCGGADVGATVVASSSASPARTLPYVDLGPSVDLRAELGPSAAFLLGVGAGVELARGSFVDATGTTFEPPLLTLDVEVAFSWTLPGEDSRRLSAKAR